MGNILSFSANSINSSSKYIDESIEELIYYPPNTAPENFTKLNTSKSILRVIKDKNGYAVPFVHIKPDKQIIDGCVVYSHGNAMDIYTAFSYASHISNLCGIDVVVYDYIGYGLSRETKPSETNCYNSIEAVVKYVGESLGYNKNKIYLYGQSLGTGVTVDYVSKHDWTTPILLVSPYKTIANVACDSSLTKPIDKFASVYKLDKVNCPVKIIHGTNDTVINVSHGRELYDKLKDKSLSPVWMKNIGHNDILYQITRNQYCDVFINKIL